MKKSVNINIKEKWHCYERSIILGWPQIEEAGSNNQAPGIPPAYSSAPEYINGFFGDPYWLGDIFEIAQTAGQNAQLQEPEEATAAVNDFLQENFKADTARDNQAEFTTEALIECGPDVLYITYENENEEGCTKTRFEINRKGFVTVSRSGAHKLYAVFEKGKRYTSFDNEYAINEEMYSTNFNITTNRLDNSLTFYGGSLNIDYVIDVNGIETEHNQFNIEF